MAPMAVSGTAFSAMAGMAGDIAGAPVAAEINHGCNALRQIATETLSHAGQSYGINWGYNTQGHVSIALSRNIHLSSYQRQKVA